MKAKDNGIFDYGIQNFPYVSILNYFYQQIYFFKDFYKKKAIISKMKLIEI